MADLTARWRAGLLLALVVLVGCESHTLTREPDPSLSSFDWSMVWVAAVAAGLMWTALTVVVFARGYQPSAGRQVAAGIFIAALVVAAAFGGLLMLSQWRVDSILGGGDCRAIPASQRPVQVLQLSCTEGEDDLALLVAVYFSAIVVAPALIFMLCIGSLLHGDRRPWFAAIVATAATVGAVALTSGASDARTSAGEWIGMLTLLAGAAVAMVLSWREVVVWTEADSSP